MSNIRFLYTSFFLLGTILALKSHAQTNLLGIDETMRKPIKIGPINSTSDDALLELSKAADVNFIADATQFSKPLPNLPDGQPAPANLEAQQDKFLNLLLKVAHQKRLTWSRSDAQTFLVWSDPDTTALAKAIINDKAASLVPETVLPAQLSAELMDYLQKDPQWEQVKGNIKAKKLKIEDLPLPLQSRIIAATQASVLHSTSMGLKTSYFNDSFWQVATLGVRPLADEKDKRWVLDIGSEWKDEKGQLFTRMGFALVNPPKTK
ncbi:hypothetical protein EON83_24885 [bacterium]|nr:MAG: hypothetical protein EON83_24885 [bacterium]